MSGENARDADLSVTDEMKQVIMGAVERFHKEMEDRFSHLFDIDSNFGFCFMSKALLLRSVVSKNKIYV